MKKVSIIIPVYNAYNTLDKLVNSLRNQTYKNIEVIFINDGSKDKSLEKLKEWQDSNFVIINKENGGVHTARNAGLKKAQGEYITFVDSDDFIDKDYVLHLVNGLEQNKADLCVMGYKKITNEKTELTTLNEENIIIDDTNKMIKFLNEQNGSAICGKLYKKKYMEEFQKIAIGEDALFNINYIKNNPKVALINNIDYNYVNNSESLTNSLKDNLLVELNTILKELKKDDIYIFYTYRIYQEYLLNIFKNNKKILKKKIKDIEQLSLVCNYMASDISKIVLNFSIFKKNYLKLVNKCFKNKLFALLYFIEKFKLELKYGK